MLAVVGLVNSYSSKSDHEDDTATYQSNDVRFNQESMDPEHVDLFNQQADHQSDSTLNDHQLIFDLHQSFLERNEALNPVQVVQPKLQPFKTVSSNVWSSPDISLSSTKEKIHSTVFCPSARVIEQKGGNSDSKGDAYLQMVVPSDSIQFVQEGGRTDSFFDAKSEAESK